MPTPPAARLDVIGLAEGGRRLVLSGEWTLRALAGQPGAFHRRLAALAPMPADAWDCSAVEAMDSAGAMLLWRTWGHRLPDGLQARPEHLRILGRIAAAEKAPADVVPRRSLADLLVQFGASLLRLRDHVLDFVVLVGQLLLDVGHMLRRPQDVPWKEISANVYKSGVRAMPVTGLVGFLIGIVLAYLLALQLRQLGADILIINILGIGIVREIGPVLVAILVAGRSGSAMTAQLGVMRVTEEIDALAAMGISRTLRLVLPKVAALAVTVPMLVFWATVMALLGSMLVSQIQLDLSTQFFLTSLARVVPIANLWIGLAKGIAFGTMVALCACHFGLRVRPNTESLSANTTASVVTAITVVIVIDALFAVATRHIGMPLR